MLFQQFANVLNQSEEVRFTLRKQPDGRLAVLIEPVMGGSSAIDDEGTAQLRAALAFPLRIVATAEELDDGLVDKLAQFARQRDPVANALESALNRAKDAIKHGHQAALSAPKKTPKSKAKAEDESGDDESGEDIGGTVESAKSPEPVGNLDSLF